MSCSRVGSLTEFVNTRIEKNTLFDKQREVKYKGHAADWSLVKTN